MYAVAHSLFPVLNILGASIAIFAATMLVPLAVAFFNHEGALVAYDRAFLVTFASSAPRIWIFDRSSSPRPARAQKPR